MAPGTEPDSDPATLSPEQRTLAEQVGHLMSDTGFQPMAGRVLGALLMTERESLTAPDLSRMLEASAASISGALRALRTIGLAERAPAPGSRREHFRFAPKMWSQVVTSNMHIYQQFQQLAEQGLKTVEDQAAVDRLSETAQFFEYMQRALPELMQQWQAARGLDGPTP